MDINTAINECVETMAEANALLDKDAWKKALSNISKHFHRQDKFIKILEAAKSKNVWDEIEDIHIQYYHLDPDSSTYPLPNRTAQFLNKAAELKILEVMDGWDNLAEVIFNTSMATADHVFDEELDPNQLLNNFIAGYRR